MKNVTMSEIVPTKYGPKNQTVPENGADHDDAKCSGPHSLRNFSFNITQRRVVERSDVITEYF